MHNCIQMQTLFASASRCTLSQSRRHHGGQPRLTARFPVSPTERNQTMLRLTPRTISTLTGGDSTLYGQGSPELAGLTAVPTAALLYSRHSGRRPIPGCHGDHRCRHTLPSVSLPLSTHHCVPRHRTTTEQRTTSGKCKHIKHRMQALFFCSCKQQLANSVGLWVAKRGQMHYGPWVFKRLTGAEKPSRGLGDGKEKLS